MKQALAWVMVWGAGIGVVQAAPGWTAAEVVGALCPGAMQIRIEGRLFEANTLPQAEPGERIWVQGRIYPNHTRCGRDPAILIAHWRPDRDAQGAATSGAGRNAPKPALSAPPGADTEHTNMPVEVSWHIDVSQIPDAVKRAAAFVAAENGQVRVLLQIPETEVLQMSNMAPALQQMASDLDHVQIEASADAGTGVEVRSGPAAGHYRDLDDARAHIDLH